MNLSLMTFPILLNRERQKLTIDDICRLCSEHDIKYLDMMLVEIMHYHKTVVKAAFEKYGIKLSCLITHVPILDKGEEEVNKAIAEGLEMADSFDCKTMMIIPHAPFILQSIEEPDKEVMTTKLIAGFTRAVSEAKKYDIKICFEDTPTCILPLSGIVECKKLLESVKGLYLTFDTANMIPAGDDPIEFYKELKSYICHVHLKDIKYVGKSNDRCADGRFIACCPLGEGVIPIIELKSMLEADGYILNAGIEYCEPEEYSYLGHAEHIEKYMNFLK